MSMGIYIKDIEMPKNHRHITITIWSNGAASYGLHDRGDSLVDFRNVEFVPIPPHGRLIDADKFKESAEISIPQYPLSRCHTYADTDIIRLIDNAPTIIPAEEGE